MSNIPLAARDICGGGGIGRANVAGRSAGSDVGGTFGTGGTGGTGGIGGIGRANVVGRSAGSVVGGTGGTGGIGRTGGSAGSVVGGTGGVMSGRTCRSTQHATTSKPGRAVVKPIGEMFRERDAVRAAKRPPTADKPAGLAAAASAAPPGSGKPSIARKRTKKANTANSHGTASVQHRRHSGSGDDDDYGDGGDYGDYGDGGDGGDYGGDYGDDGGGEDDKRGWRKKENEGKGDWCNDDDGDDDAGSEEEEDEEHSSDRDFIAPTEEEDEEEPDNRSSGSANKPQLVNDDDDDDDDDGLIGGLCQNLEAQARRTCHAPKPKKHKHGDRKKQKHHIKKPKKLKKTTKSHKHRVRKKPRFTRVILSDNGSDGSDGGAAASLTGQCRIPAHATIQTSRSDRALHTSTLSTFRAETTTVTAIPVETMASLVQRLAGTLRTMCAACSDVTAAMQRASGATALPSARCLPAALVFGTTDARSSVSTHRMSQYVAQLQRAGAEHTKHLRAASRCAMQQQRSNPRGAFTTAAPLIAAPAIAAAPFSCNEHMRNTSPCTRVSLPSQFDNAVPNSRPVATHVKPVPAATDNEYTDAELADVLGAAAACGGRDSCNDRDEDNTNNLYEKDKVELDEDAQTDTTHAEPSGESDAEMIDILDSAKNANTNAKVDAKATAGGGQEDTEKARPDAEKETVKTCPNKDTAGNAD